ncbi:2176_t:CDS:2 [Gigaspora margarita]|uniref:2176_t:CDS:1 n=1 Tax=Gigaspora margarita TaxID=4874 RepID=A0ABN7UIJ3_GIGMA|nr:2176_t:CDS:2 [Gigaspora margarita]
MKEYTLSFTIATGGAMKKFTPSNIYFTLGNIPTNFQNKANAKALVGIIPILEVLASIIGDWPENCKLCLTYNGASCTHPCHTYLVKKDELNAIKLSTNRKIIQTEDQMQQAIAAGQGKLFVA